jgi:superfamily II DNA/RNA helicase
MSDCMTLTPPFSSQAKADAIEIDIIAECESAEDALFAGAVYHEIRQELARRGVPLAQVAFIQDYKTKAQRAALFAALNRGDIRVLIASKQSTGMNIQKRLIALHHLDCPWRPGDLEQREGRIIRQGNQFPEAMVFAYVTEGSFDGYSWQTIHTKAGFIEQMKRGDVTVREIDDIGDAVLSAAEIKAIASGNPLVMEKVKLEAEVQKLEAAEAADRANRVRMRRRLADGELERTQLERRLPFLAAARAQAEATYAEKEFRAAILQGVLGNEATAYTKREAAGEAVLKVIGELDALAMQQRERQTRTIGRYRGFLLRGNAYTMGAADLTVCFEHKDQIRAISATSTALKTPIGVFASIDRQLQGIGEEITRAERRLTELAQDDAKIQAMLAAPWPQTTGAS